VAPATELIFAKNDFSELLADLGGLRNLIKHGDHMSQMLDNNYTIILHLFHLT